MVDNSERAFRLLCLRHGVELAYTPMLHAEPFAANRDYRNMAFDAWEPAFDQGRDDADRPLIAQLGGDDPKTMLRAARILEKHVDAVDINFGCPTEDARIGGHKSHSPRCRRFGAYLLPDVRLVKELVGTLASGLQSVPVTAKMRLLENQEASLEVALAIEEAGAAALCVHGRTVLQRPKYADRTRAGGPVDQSPSWEAITAIRRAVNIPVIANGGIGSRDDAVRCLGETGAAAVMSAEALLEDPALFEDRPLEASDSTNAPGYPSAEVQRMLGLAREFLDLAESYPSTLNYPPTKSHLFKILHRLLGADQAEARRRDAAGLPLDLRTELKLVLMRCKVQDLTAIRAALDEVEARYSVMPRPELGPPWYRRWRHLSPESTGARPSAGSKSSARPRRQMWRR